MIDTARAMPYNVIARRSDDRRIGHNGLGTAGNDFFYSLVVWFALVKRKPGPIHQAARE